MQPAFLLIGRQRLLTARTANTHTDRYGTHTVLRRTVPQLSRRPFRSRRLRCPLQRRQAKSWSHNGKRDGKRCGKRDGTRNGKRGGTSALAATDVVLMPLAAPHERRPEQP
jgi:hypothetical protein